MEQRQTWMNIDEIFPEGGTWLEDQWFSNEQIRELNLPSIQTFIHKPVRRMTEKEWRVTWYNDGHTDFDVVYSAFLPNNVDGIPVLNVYGCKMLTNYLERLNETRGIAYYEDDEETFDIDYASL